MRMLRSPVTTISRQPPVPVPLCFAGFASNPAWHASFRFLPYFRGSFSLNRDRMSKGILRGGMGRSKRRKGFGTTRFVYVNSKQTRALEHCLRTGFDHVGQHGNSLEPRLNRASHGHWQPYLPPTLLASPFECEPSFTIHGTALNAELEPAIFRPFAEA